ncbi:hypothetical protein L1049_014270 [Liquidambar formosana]|uniref:Uncharacterized protein n=1 Tax=Liquidambar formosana TaxID=63359 RepID=A0AAP0RRW7_LIQFO
MNGGRESWLESTSASDFMPDMSYGTPMTNSRGWTFCNDATWMDGEAPQHFMFTGFPIKSQKSTPVVSSSLGTLVKKPSDPWFPSFVKQ